VACGGWSKFAGAGSETRVEQRVGWGTHLEQDHVEIILPILYLSAFSCYRQVAAERQFYNQERRGAVLRFMGEGSNDGVGTSSGVFKL
jgi:hypothetical protein